MKITDDNWHFIITNAANNSLVISDPTAKTGYFTKELAARMKVQYLRQIIGGDMVRGGLTHLFVSLEAIEHLREQSASLDEETRRRLFTIEKKLGIKPFPPQLYGMELCPLSEFGVGQKFQSLYEALGGTYNGDDVELVIGAEFKGGVCFNCIAGSF